MLPIYLCWLGNVLETIPKLLVVSLILYLDIYYLPEVKIFNTM
jgi:hypothetical protein